MKRTPLVPHKRKKRCANYRTQAEREEARRQSARSFVARNLQRERERHRAANFSKRKWRRMLDKDNATRRERYRTDPSFAAKLRLRRAVYYECNRKKICRRARAALRRPKDQRERKRYERKNAARRRVADKARYYRDRAKRVKLVLKNYARLRKAVLLCVELGLTLPQKTPRAKRWVKERFAEALVLQLGFVYSNRNWRLK